MIKKIIVFTFIFISCASLYAYKSTWQTARQIYYNSKEGTRHCTYKSLEKIKQPEQISTYIYLFISDNKLYLYNVLHQNYFLYDKKDQEFKSLLKKNFPKDRYDYIYKNFRFYLNNNYIVASSKDVKYKIKIKKGSFPYVYAFNNEKVLSVTNWGDAVIFDIKTKKWTRMSYDLKTDTYFLPNNYIEPLVETPREVQFYSSIHWNSKVLLGQWPTGQIYFFTGDKIVPSSLSPPFVSKKKIRI